MSRDVRFSFDSEAQKQEYMDYAEARGLTLSAFAKHACFTVKDRYRFGSHHPAKGRGRRAAPRVVGQETGQLDGT